MGWDASLSPQVQVIGRRHPQLLAGGFCWRQWLEIWDGTPPSLPKFRLLAVAILSCWLEALAGDRGWRYHIGDLLLPKQTSPKNICAIF